MPFRMPRHDEHLAIVGRNGSGKTQMGAHVLSKMDLRNEITIILDYKGDELLNSIRRFRDIAPGELPTHHGVYIMHAMPEDDDERVEKTFRKIWNAGDIRLYIDEGYMAPQRAPFRALLTQGRALRIPVITLSQRPVEIDRFVFSEASHVAFFHLNDERDEKTIRMFTPKGFLDYIPPEYAGADQLPKYHSRWYALKDNEKYVLSPVPEADEIRDRIEEKLERKLQWV